MIYITYNEDEGKFKTTQKADKSVAYCGRFYRFQDYETDYASGLARFATSNLNAKKVKLCTCLKCKQVFAVEAESSEALCPKHTGLWGEN